MGILLKNYCTILLALCTLYSCERTPGGEFLNIKNNTFWDTQDGQPIYSQGGGIFRFTDSASGIEKYYWYGVQYQEAAQYRNDPSVTLPRATFEYVTCYSSTDLVNWTFENNVLDTTEAFRLVGHPTWVGRLGVAYVKEINQYAMFVQNGDQVLVALSDSPTGSFKSHQRINMKGMIGTTNTGDQTVFTDEDTGKSYLVYSYGRGRNRIYISEIGITDDMVGLLDCTQIFKGSGREGNCMFKYKGKYYMFASNLYGWDSSFAYYLVADNIRGPYLPANEMLITPGSMQDYAHVTQTGFFVNVKGTKQETVIYCGDRWADFAGNGLGYNQWCPLSFNGETPYFNSLSSWNLNAVTGEWEVADDNNYVKNGSFEADRNKIPSNFKPVQEQLLGWNTIVMEGNPITVNDTNSPQLNYMNSRDDRKIATGEKSLNISDKIPFKRQVSQQITSSPYVLMPDGDYTLTAKIRNSGGFTRLDIYVQNNDVTMIYNIINSDTLWQAVRFGNIPVKGGKAEVGFLAEGAAGAQCLIDDIALVRSRSTDR